MYLIERAAKLEDTVRKHYENLSWHAVDIIKINEKILFNTKIDVNSDTRHIVSEANYSKHQHNKNIVNDVCNYTKAPNSTSINE